MPEKISLIPERGERALIVGQTGSGKTGFACWLLKRIDHAPIIIYDTKDESKFVQMTGSQVVTDWEQLIEAFQSGEADYIVFRPHPSMLGDPQELDELLYRHYMELRGVTAYVDEIYSFHTTTGRPFKGLLNLLQRGRSRGITTIISTQTPRFLSNFALTEAQKIYVFYLKWDQDIKKLNEMIPGFKDNYSLKPKTYQFYFHDAASNTTRLFAPIRLDKEMDTGYTDMIATETPDAERVKGLLWS